MAALSFSHIWHMMQVPGTMLGEGGHDMKHMQMFCTQTWRRVACVGLMVEGVSRLTTVPITDLPVSVF